MEVVALPIDPGQPRKDIDRPITIGGNVLHDTNLIRTRQKLSKFEFDINRFWSK